MSKKKDDLIDIPEQTECVQVVIRCRPLSSTEVANKNQRIVGMDKGLGQVMVTNPNKNTNKPKTFTYDNVFDENTTQEQIFEECARAIVQSTLDGYNGTIFAYGQTGTGKTFTMEGVENDPVLRGVTPRCFNQIFDSIAGSDATHLVRASFLEIYQDNVIDLLEETKRGVERKHLALKEHPESGVYVKDLKTPVVQDVNGLRKILQRGKKHRVVGATKMNEGSSRSHCIFTITIETSEKGDDGQDHIRVGKLNLVDLAGSERQTKTGASGTRLKEAAKINLALSALGNVINGLTKKGGVASHIPYRDSKLTRLLQDSLGGNTKTVMIANIGPADYNYEETISTLRFATRAKTIENKPQINEDPKDAMLRQFQEEIQRLKAMLEAENARVGSGGAALTDNSDFLRAAGVHSPQKVVVQKVVEKVVTKGVTPEQLEQARLEHEQKKREVEEKALQEIEQSRAVRAQMLAQAHGYKEKIKKKEHILIQGRQMRESLQHKLKQIENQLVVGTELIEEAKKEKLVLQRKQEQARRNQLQLEDKLRKKRQLDEQQLDLEQKFNSQEQELQFKNKKLDKLRNKYSQIKQEIEDVQAENQREREDMLETIRELTRQIQLKDVIMQHFVPYEEHIKVNQRAYWDDETDEWVLAPLDLATQNIKVRRPRSALDKSSRSSVPSRGTADTAGSVANHKYEKKRPVCEYARVRSAAGDTNPRYKVDNIIQLGLDMPERTTQDYHIPGDFDEPDSTDMSFHDEDDPALYDYYDPHSQY